MKISVLTLGCKTNQAESFNIEQALKSSGNEIVDISGEPDICIINTCSVTSKADQQSRQVINKALKNNVKVIVTGCYAELNDSEIKKLKGNIEIVKNSDKDKIINKFNLISSGSTLKQNNYPRHRPIIKVQDGCNYSCSYCTIPKARGRSSSVLEEKIINEVRFYESLGYKEVVLTGIHLGTYGLDSNPKKSLSTLLESLLMNTKIQRIRLSSLEIKEIDERLLELLADKRICNHLHIPIQNGDDNVLRLMNRTYSLKDFIAGIEVILKRHPDIALGTDVIVGFPGEGDVEFKNTKHVIQAIPFSYLHVFPYSLRPGTKATALPNHVSESIKKERVSILREISDTKKKAYIQRNIDNILDIIIESEHEEGYIGTTGNYIKVLLPVKNNINVEMLMNVRIAGRKDNYALGFPENNQKPLNK